MHANTIKADIRRNNRMMETDRKLLSLEFVNNDQDFLKTINTSIERKTKANELLAQALKLKNRIARYSFLKDNGFYAIYN
jgi:hypothetical protein